MAFLTVDLNNLPGDPCPGRELSYFGRVTCRPIDAVTRAILPATAIGASFSTITYPGAQYAVPLWQGTARGAAAGAMVGAAITAMAYAKKYSGSNLVAAGVGVVAVPAALYGALRIGAIPTA